MVDAFHSLLTSLKGPDQVPDSEGQSSRMTVLTESVDTRNSSVPGITEGASSDPKAPSNNTESSAAKQQTSEVASTSSPNTDAASTVKVDEEHSTTTVDIARRLAKIDIKQSKLLQGIDQELTRQALKIGQYFVRRKNQGHRSSALKKESKAHTKALEVLTETVEAHDVFARSLIGSLSKQKAGATTGGTAGGITGTPSGDHGESPAKVEVFQDDAPLEDGETLSRSTAPHASPEPKQTSSKPEGQTEEGIRAKTDDAVTGFQQLAEQLAAMEMRQKVILDSVANKQVDASQTLQSIEHKSSQQKTKLRDVTSVQLRHNKRLDNLSQKSIQHDENLRTLTRSVEHQNVFFQTLLDFFTKHESAIQGLARSHEGHEESFNDLFEKLLNHDNAFRGLASQLSDNGKALEGLDQKLARNNTSVANHLRETVQRLSPLMQDASYLQTFLTSLQSLINHMEGKVKEITGGGLVATDKMAKNNEVLTEITDELEAINASTILQTLSTFQTDMMSAKAQEDAHAESANQAMGKTQEQLTEIATSLRALESNISATTMQEDDEVEMSTKTVKQIYEKLTHVTSGLEALKSSVQTLMAQNSDEPMQDLSNDRDGAPKVTGLSGGLEDSCFRIQADFAMPDSTSITSGEIVIGPSYASKMKNIISICRAGWMNDLTHQSVDSGIIELQMVYVLLIGNAASGLTFDSAETY